MLTLLLVVSAIGAEPDAKAIEAAVAKIRNEDIHWDGNFVGLMPSVRGEASWDVRRLGKSAVPALLAALEDPDRFAAAHVLLSDTDRGGFAQSSAKWNGLEVHVFRAPMMPEIPSEQRFALQRHWKTRLTMYAALGPQKTLSHHEFLERRFREERFRKPPTDH